MNFFQFIIQTNKTTLNFDRTFKNITNSHRSERKVEGNDGKEMHNEYNYKLSFFGGTVRYQ